MGAVIKRRRECLMCGYRFTTYEIATEDFKRYVKKKFRGQQIFKEITIEHND